MFTKEQRNVLNSLSKDIFGTESQWRKMIKNPKFRIVEEVVSVNKKKYVETRVNRASGDRRGGTVWSYEKALAKGMIKPDQEVGQQQTFKTREPSFDELKLALESNLDMLLLSHLEKEQQAMVFAKRLVDGNLLYSVSLVLGSNKKEDFDGLVASAPENLREQLNKMLVPDDADFKNTTVFDAVTFVSNVVFASAHSEKCVEEVSVIMGSAKAKRDEVNKAAKKSFAAQRLAF